jgi:hypothetical protein
MTETTATCQTCPFATPLDQRREDGTPEIRCHHTAAVNAFETTFQRADWWCSEHPERSAVAGRLELTRGVIGAADAICQELGGAEWSDAAHAEEILRGLINRHWKPLRDALRAHPLDAPEAP